ncbi:MAG: family 78 glycoside hydrolase catalytic domain [Alistipes sp.]|nr:family 78 glycoside hydrolase catalytic domain [Alistipes sp.]
MKSMIKRDSWVLALLLCVSISSYAAEYVGKRIEALDDTAWGCSQWISAVDAPIVEKRENRAADGASWFVSTIKNEKRVVSAKWMTTSLGVHEIYVNGDLVGEEVLKPGYTHPLKTRLSFTYDITEAFDCKAKAKNQLSAQVTPGWWADKVVTGGKYKKSMLGKKCAFRGVLELTFEDGTKRLYGTNLNEWKAGIAGPVKHAGIFDGEEYDAREKMGYEVASKLAASEINTEFSGKILPSMGAEVYCRYDLAMSPVKAYCWKGVAGANEKEYGKVIVTKEFAPNEEIVLKAGETLVVDFGQNSSAVPSFVFKAAKGTTLTCLPGEILNDCNGAKNRRMDGPEGSVLRRNLRIPKEGMILKYTFAKSKDYVHYQPRCSFFGYRYVSVTATDDVLIRKITSVPVTSITSKMDIGRITTGNELINRLISNTYWGQLSNYLSVPTDCPQRNERQGWTADTQVFAETGSFFANTLDFLSKWMADMRDSQNKKGAFPSVAPMGQNGGNYMRLGWADAGVIVPWVMWKQFGDAKIVSDNWESMSRFMDYIYTTKYDHNVLAKENRNSQYADWVSYEPLESYSKQYRDKKTKKPLPEAIDYWNYLSAAYWAIDADMMADMAAATGRNEAKYRKMAQEARTYIKERFVNADGTFKTAILNTMQTPALFALRVGVVEGDGKAAMIERLRKNFEEHGNCLQTGFLGTSILMSTLTDNGMNDIAYELLFQRKNPSWLYSVDNGATTIWERWDGYTKEHGLAKGGMNSFNHYAYGCVCEWIWETAAGISSDVSAPGFKHIVMKPVPDKRLGFVKAEYNSAAGLIKSAWHYEGDKWIWEFTIPEGSTASVTLPGESEAKLYNSGSYKMVR